MRTVTYRYIFAENNVKKYTTIFFDIGGVLFNLELEDTVNYLADKSGIDRDTVEKSFPLDEYFDFERGRMNEYQFFEHWRNGIGVKQLSDNDFVTAWDILIGRELGTVGILEKLLPHYQIWLLSNTNAHHMRKLTPRFPVFDKVHGKIYSYQLDCRKPEPRIFELALEQAGARAEEAIFIDDMEVNVEQSRKMGITTIHFTSAEELEVELKLLGLQGLD